MILGTKIICVSGGLLLAAVFRGAIVTNEAPLPRPSVSTNTLVAGLQQLVEVKQTLPAVQLHLAKTPTATVIAPDNSENDHRLLLNHLQLTK
jgi:hypothetical protein